MFKGVYDNLCDKSLTYFVKLGITSEYSEIWSTVFGEPYSMLGNVYDNLCVCQCGNVEFVCMLVT